MTDTPTSQELVRELVIGSRAVDRMRREINCVVKMVFGFIDKEYDATDWSKSSDTQRPVPRHYYRLNFQSSNYRWAVTGTRETNTHCIGLDWCVDCYSKLDGSGRVEQRDLYSFRQKRRPHPKDSLSGQIGHIPLRDVRSVHESLPVLVSGLIGDFPFLADRLQLLFNAADYAEKNGWRF